MRDPRVGLKDGILVRFNIGSMLGEVQAGSRIMHYPNVMSLGKGPWDQLKNSLCDVSLGTSISKLILRENVRNPRGGNPSHEMYFL